MAPDLSRVRDNRAVYVTFQVGVCGIAAIIAIEHWQQNLEENQINDQTCQHMETGATMGGTRGLMVIFSLIASPSQRPIGGQPRPPRRIGGEWTAAAVRSAFTAQRGRGRVGLWASQTATGRKNIESARC